MNKNSFENINSISIIIPAYNEGQRIGDSLTKIIEYMEQKDFAWELIVVDDASTDNTVSIVRNLVPNQNLKIIINDTNLGKGASIKKGMLEAQGDILLFTDADLSAPIEEFDKFIDEFKNGYDVVIGSRALPESCLEIHQPIYREKMGKIFNFFVQAIVIKGIKDTQCGFKAFTKKCAYDIFSKQRLKRFSFDVEILFLAKHHGYKIKEVPVKWINSPASKVNAVKDSLIMFFDLFRIRFGI